MLLVYCALPEPLIRPIFGGLGIDLDPEDDTIVKAPVAGDCGWGPTDQVVEPEVGVPRQGG